MEITGWLVEVKHGRGNTTFAVGDKADTLSRVESLKAAGKDASARVIIANAPHAPIYDPRIHDQQETAMTTIDTQAVEQAYELGMRIATEPTLDRGSELAWHLATLRANGRADLADRITTEMACLDEEEASKNPAYNAFAALDEEEGR